MGIISGCAAFSFAALALLVALAVAQPATDTEDDGCNGVLLTYTLESRERIRPFVPTAAGQSSQQQQQQAYSFRANASVLNSGTRALRSWALLVTFAHGEILVGVDGAVLTSSGAELPYNTSTTADATSFSGLTDLLTPIATAGDLSKIQATVRLVGTLFADDDQAEPLPSALSLADPAYACPKAAATTINNASSTISTCCVLTNTNTSTSTSTSSGMLDTSSVLRPGIGGDLVISYDVVQSHESSYLALVTIENNAPLARLDGWRLSWEWQRGEFIGSMRGAYPLQVSTAGCLYGPQGQYYQDLDFSKVLSCDRRPVVLDLPASRRDDPDIGRIDHCCRNGTILPKSMAQSSSESAFQMEVYKMPPDLDRAELHPPANFRITGGSPLNPEFTCGQPVPVTPSESPDPSGLASRTVAIATWQLACNISSAADTTTATQSKNNKPPRCCVSFSAFYNESVIPCNTCACGCPARTPASYCSTTAPPLLLPPYALLMPFERRAKEALTWADQKHLHVPNPMPCGDYCGVSINWHVASDFAAGWTARLTLFNWDHAADMPDWFAAVVMGNHTFQGFDQAYSFNATTLGVEGGSNNTIFIKGRDGFNDFLLRETNVSGVDYPVPGKVQSVLSFKKKKKNDDDIDVLAGDGFPTKVFFNGHECAMPHTIPSLAVKTRATSLLAAPLLLFLLLL